MRKKYMVKEIFKTLQGEGEFAGRPAIFVRFVGCNLWSGYHSHRRRDASRNGAECPLWCDTDFTKAGARALSDVEICAEISELAGRTVSLVVFTGGEPLLHLDPGLVARAYDVVARPGAYDPKVMIETNGTIANTPVTAPGWIWVCVSPKVSVEKLAIDIPHVSEVKLVFGALLPDFDLQAARIVAHFGHPARVRYSIQPQALLTPLETKTGVGSSRLLQSTMVEAAEWCMAHPPWRLSVQTHKILGLP